MENELEIIANKYINPDDGMKVDERLLDILSSKMLEYIKGPKVLEMGVGAGMYTKKVIDKYNCSYIVDASNKLLMKQKEMYGDKINTFNYYFEEFNPPIKFDTILATNILEHLDDPIKVLSKMKKWLNDDGKILIVVPNANSMHRNYGLCLGMIKELTDLNDSDIKIGHRRVYTWRLLEKHINLSGLKVIERYPTFIKLLSNSQMKDFTDQQMEGLFELAKNLPDLIEYNADIFFEVQK